MQNNNINNQSINFNVNPNMSQHGTMGNNPNLFNPMFNPMNPGMMPMYQQPNAYDVNSVERVRKVQYLREFEKKVNSFIEVKVVYYKQTGVFRTDAVDSIHPDYNHQFDFEIKPKNGMKYFTREELAKCPGMFYFTLYDEVKRETTVKALDSLTYMQRFEKKYLGSFSIPFVTVFQNASILDTICKVNVPKTVFGYYTDASDTFDVIQNIRMGDEVNNMSINPQATDQNMNNTNMNQQMPKENYKIINPFINTYISLYITLDPVPIFSMNDDSEYSPGFEDSIFLINGTKWLKAMKDKSLLKDRCIRLFADNFDGYSVFMPRYLKPDGQKPHSLLFNSETSTLESDPNAIERVAHYVSLIPFVEDNQAWDTEEELPDCWCTDNEFLTLGFGDYEEHAILLCNYFNYVDRIQNNNCISYIVLGDAHPEGQTTYVIRISQDTKEVELWNAKTGDCFYFDKTIQENKCWCITVSKQFRHTRSKSDTICQLKSVGAIVTFDNIYINMQKESDPG